MSDYVTCQSCHDGSCPACEGDGGYEIAATPPHKAKWETCPACMGTRVCQSCFGQVTTVNPYAHAVLPILPNDQESWGTLLFPLL